VRDGIFEIEHGGDGVRAMQNGAFGWKARLLKASQLPGNPRPSAN
jgi:hypothetical protein